MTDFTAESLGLAFINIAWRGTAVLALAYAAVLLLPTLSASRRREISLLSLAVVVSVTIATLFNTTREVLNPPQASLLSRLVGIKGELQILTAVPPNAATVWLQVAIGLWIAGTVFALMRTSQRLWHSIRAVREAAPVADTALLGSVTLFAGKAGLVRVPEVRQLATIETAAVCGVWHPVILVSASWSTWSLDRRQQILSHELCHVRNHDIPVTLFAQFARALLWWNPALHVAVRNLALQQEFICDEQVVRAGASAESYAETLLDLAKSSSSRVNVALLAIAESAIPERVERVLRVEQFAAPRWHRWYSRIVIAAALLGLALLPGVRNGRDAMTEEVIDMRDLQRSSPASVRIDRDASGNIRVQPSSPASVR